MKIGISIHLDFYRSRELTIQHNEGELYSRCIIVSLSTLLKMNFIFKGSEGRVFTLY